MKSIKNFGAGLVGSIALNLLHESLRKYNNNVPKIHLLGEQAIQKSRMALGKPAISDKDELYSTTLKADLMSNAVYYSLIGGKRSLIWPKAVLLGLCAGIGALKLPETVGLDPSPVTATPQKKALTVGYYLFGALVTAFVLSGLTKSKS